MRQIRLMAATAAGFALAVGAVGAVTPVTAAAPGTGPAVTPRTHPAASATGTATVRLITGDTVTVEKGADGHQTATVRPGTGRDGIVFHTYEQDGHISVLPSDAQPLVSAGRLDRSLFDVTALLAQRYDTAHTSALPLLVGTADGASAAAARRLTAFAEQSTAAQKKNRKPQKSQKNQKNQKSQTAGTVRQAAAPPRDLPSIHARALSVPQQDLGRFWDQLAPAAGASRTASALAAVPRVRLDARVRAVLDRSTAQINAPAVWQKGDRGEGVKVAVLDTGVDQNHPDLAGRISKAQDFSGSSGPGDVFGHGTHVASIVGGSGAASGGTRKGVAPAADLLIGKVLGDDGYGTESAVIAGMEWAAAQGAKVVNMSLSSDTPSDGTDAMSLALNELSRSTGTLFVTAAGNSGADGASTIGAPAAADDALTVGAVDRDDSLADFSSRGPRAGDGALKPDVTAPGVGIVAARAAGTTMGDPVDQYYTAASGTSMATPHVAGAAALVAHEHPDWTGAQIKDALVSTARTIDGQKAPEQGGGRIDASAAALGTVTATGSLTLGSFHPGDAPRTATLNYTNTSGADITLALSPRLTDADGRPAPADTVRLSSPTVRVPAHGTAAVTLTADTGRTGRGTYYGYVTAAASGAEAATVHTTLGLTVHAPVHRLTVVSYDEHGKRVPLQPVIWGADGFESYKDPAHGIAEVEEGTYQVNETFLVDAKDGQEMREVVLPEVKVTEDTTVTVDARATVPVEIRTPRPAEQRGAISYQTYRALDGHSLLQGTMYFDLAKRVYASPAPPVKEGTFEFSSRWQLVAPLLETRAAGLPGTLNTYYMPASPLFGERGATLEAADAGDVSAPALGRVRGKIAVLTNTTWVNEADVVQRAAAAGAKAVLLVQTDDNPWTRWRPDGDRWAAPTIRVGATDGAEILKLAHRHPERLTFHGTSRSPYLYDVMQISKQEIPKHITYTVSERTSATVRTTYADNGGAGWAAEQRFARRPFQQTTWNQYNRFVPTGFTRTEYISAGDTVWQHLVHHTTVFDQDQPLAIGERDTPRTYRARERSTETWQGAVVRPSIPAGTTHPTTRTGNVLNLWIPEFTDSQPGHWTRLLEGGFGAGAASGTAPAATGDTTAAVLYRNGKKYADLPSAWLDAEVPAEQADYRLDLTTSRTEPEWHFATATSTSWSFRSQHTEQTAPLPLLQLDYDVPVDARNTVTAHGSYGVGVTVRAQDGAPAPRGVTVRVETSTDGGHTWHTARTGHRTGTAFRATVARTGHGHGTSYVSLRVTAQDSLGNSVRQTVERAWAERR
uniref:S8 family peptidase n=1 Tax=Streptomyces sp. SAT1 TaxID=1849967 RepID=UPI00144AEEBC|nr:S8 family peptidase [Streptomyces sp. SAT1]